MLMSTKVHARQIIEDHVTSQASAVQLPEIYFVIVSFIAG